MEWKNLAPDLVRQRIIIEGTTEKIVEPEQIKAYLDELAKVTKMEKLSGPYVYTAHDMWATVAGFIGNHPEPLFIPTQLIRHYSLLTAIPANHFPAKRPLNLPENFLTQLI